MPVRIDSNVATATMLKAGFETLAPYRNTSTPWKSKHIKCGRIVSPTLNSIHQGQGGCAYCAGTKIDPSEAKKLFLSKELKPIEPYQGNKHPWKSIHIPCGNEVSPTYNIIQRGESMGCRFCSDQFVDPEAAYKFFLSKNLQPLVPYPGTAKPWKSIHLVCGSEIQPRYAHIKAGRVGCVVCSGKVKISQSKAVAFFRSKGLEPKGKFPGPNKGWKSVHTECGRTVSPRWANVQQGLGVCVYCSGRKVDMKEVKALLKKLDLKPLVPYPGGKIPWKCIHLICGNEVTPRYNSISRGQGACIHCAGMVVSKTEARNIFVNAGLNPLTPYPGSGKPWPSIHKTCGNKVSPTYSSIRDGGKGCIYCAGLAPITEKEADELFKKHGFTPLVKFPGAKKPWKVRHNVCGKVVSPTYGSVRRGGGCKYCQIGGINLLAPAYLYLITNKSLNSHKIGIGGFDSSINRLDQHRKQGWNLFNQLDFETAEDAYAVEQLILDWLRADLGLPQYLLPEQMPQRGHTETVDASEIDLPTIWAEVLKRSRTKK